MRKMSVSNIPNHVAIIMDGNRRWAKKRGLGAVAGHRRATDYNVEELIEKCGEMGIKYLTLWAFSTENWKRDKREIEGVLKLFRRAIREKVAKFVEKGAKLQVIGDLSRFPEDIRKGLDEAIEKSEGNTKIVVTFALNYGGRDEMVRAVRKIVDSGVNASEVNEELISSNLDTKGMPDPDLIIRTGGVFRMSGFMAWQGVYSEYYFTDTLFPDFDKNELEKALIEYGKRERRFGGGKFK